MMVGMNQKDCLCFAGFYYFLLPVYMWIKNLVWPKKLGGF